MATVDSRMQGGREAYERLAWRDAYEQLWAADQQAPLEADDLDRMARAAYLIGAIDAATETWERVHHAFLKREDAAPAARCAFWIGLTLVLRGEHVRGGGWLARAQRILEDAALDCAEQGYLRIPTALRALDGGDPEVARRSFVEITEIVDRFDDSDLRTFGRLGQGQSLVAQGLVAQGVVMLDEAMVSVTTAGLTGQAADDEHLFLDVAQTRQLLGLARHAPTSRRSALYRERDLAVLGLEEPPCRIVR